MQHAVITCRNDQQITDDAITQAHTDVTKLLNATTGLGTCLYRGARRAALRAIQYDCERYILGEGPAPFAVQHRIHTILTAHLPNN